LELSRPLAVLDIQSTGLKPDTARIVRLSVLKVDPDGTEHVKSVIVNPGVSIPASATQVHGISDSTVADEPVFQAYARALADHLEGCDLTGFGIERFGLPLLQAEFKRNGVDFILTGRAIVDAMTVFHRLEPRNFSSAYSRFVGGIYSNSDDGAKRARDVFEILKGELRASSEVPVKPNEIAKWTKGLDDSVVDSEGKFIWSEDGDVQVNFGKHRGERLADVVTADPDYLNWLSGSEDFSEEVRNIAGSAISGRLPERS
jgi:DNA polymerase-3 subunit epsilon